MTNNIKSQLQELKKFEDLELTVINLYTTLLEMGIIDNIDKEHKEIFKQKMDTLLSDSQKHKDTIQKIIDSCN